MTITIQHPNTKPTTSTHYIVALIAVIIVAAALVVAFRFIGTSSDGDESPVVPAVYVASAADLFEQRASTVAPARYAASTADLFEQRLTTSG